MTTSADKNISVDEESHGDSGTPEDQEKRYSSNCKSVVVETVTNHESLPINQANHLDEATSLEKLDSKVIKVNEDDDPFKHLPDHERTILKQQTDVTEVKVNYITLYRYATKMDILILVISAISAIAAGAAMPLMTVSTTLNPCLNCMLTSLGHLR
jgi:hypothetical protein